MLSRKIQNTIAILALAGATAGLTGCQEVRRPHPTAAFLDGGNDPVKVTAKQAADVQVALGRSMENQEDYEGAIGAYKVAIQKDPRRADAYNRLAVLHDRQGKFQLSADYYQKALDLKPGDAEIFADKGYSLYLQRRWAEAEMNLKQAALIKPSLARAHNNLGLVLAHNRRVEEALAEFKKSGLNDADAHANVAFALALDNQTEDAREHYETALALNPASDTARMGLNDLNRAMVNINNADNVRALAARRAPAVDPSVATASQITPVPATPALTAPVRAATPAAVPALTAPASRTLPSPSSAVPAAALRPATQPAYSAAFGQPAGTTVAARRPLAVGDTAVRVTSGTAPAVGR